MNTVVFDSLDSYADLGLYLTSREIGLPSPKISSVEIPGADGAIDLSEALTGEMRYSDRVLKFTFAFIGNRLNAASKKMMVFRLIHGRRMKITLSEQPQYYYYGRVTISDSKSTKRVETITVSVDADPYIYKASETVISFSVNSSEAKTISLLSRMSVIPVINVSSDMTAKFNETTYALSSGDNKNLGIVLCTGDNRIDFTGTGTVKISFREGEL